MNNQHPKTRAEVIAAMIHGDLLSLLNRSHRTLTGCHLTNPEIECLTRYVAEIRRLLGEMESLHVWSEDEVTGCSMYSVREQFLDLEGRIKELRNDSERNGC